MPEFEILIKDAIRNYERNIEFIVYSEDCPDWKDLLGLCDEISDNTGMLIEHYTYPSTRILGIVHVGFNISY